MKRLKTEHANTYKRKQQIIKGALSCFNEFGVTETAMSDICKRSETSIGSIYHHFKSKEQLAVLFESFTKNLREGYFELPNPRSEEE